MKKEKFLHQKLINEAYGLYEQNPDWSYDDFIQNIPYQLSKLHLYAVVIGNMNYQVENGGWLQWHMNDYSEKTIDYIREALDSFSITSSKEAKEIAEKLNYMLDDVMKSVETLDQINKGLIYFDYQLLEKIINQESPFLLLNIGEVSEKVYEILDNSGFHEMGEISEEEAKEIAGNIKIELGLKESLDLAFLIKHKEPDEYIARIAYEYLVYECAEKIKKDIVSFLENLSSEYYKFNERFLELFEEWLETQQIK